MSFLVPADVDWVKAIAAGNTVVHVTVSDDKHGVYLALTGRAGVDASPARANGCGHPWRRPGSADRMIPTCES